jgi:hypothetical protein
MKLLLLALLCCCALPAQVIDTERSGFLSAPNGRTGTWAPYRLVLREVVGDTLTVSSEAPGVTLTRQVAVAGLAETEVVIPVFVGEGARLGVGQAAHEPTLPLRRVDPDYARPYVAVFSSDPVYARGVLPSTPRGAICDYYELSGFFGDWRLLDGYDAVVIFNPLETRLPAGSQRALAEFCSLGGAALIVGSFRFGEKAVDLPPPAELQVMQVRDVQLQRMGYGAGAIYRVGFDELRLSQSAPDVIIEALRDQLWFGAGQAPAGTPESRVPPVRTPMGPPLPPPDAAPSPLFWGLAGGLLLLCGLAPLVAGRLTRRAWPAQLALLAGCAGIAGLALLQTRPLPTLEVSALLRGGEGEARCARVFLLAEREWTETLTVDLDDQAYRGLPRKLPGRPGWHAWAEDLPLVAQGAGRAGPVRLAFGMVGKLSFRDFSTRAHRGETGFSTDDAHLLEWWLDANAYRGRRAELQPLEWRFPERPGAELRVVPRGAIGVTVKREGG